MHGPLTDDELALVFLQQFDEKGNEFGDANEAVVSEIKSKLLLAELVVHSVSGRVKSRDSFERKMRKNLNRPVQDVVGVRIITHYREDVRRVEAILREILIVDDGTYVDKATMLAPGAFGYRSVQFVGQIPNEGFGSDHTSLANRMHGMSWMGESAGTVEVQIRSILEHAWAEVDHELIYKAERPAPFAVQRKFALTAALLESADTHLDSIREELLGTSLRDSSQADADDGMGGYVQRLVETDLASLALDAQITAALDLPRGFPEKHSREVVNAVMLAGWRGIADLRQAIAESGVLAKRMAIACVDVSGPIILADYTHPSVRAEAFPGIGLYWLGIAAGARPDSSEFASSIAIPDGRLREYHVVASYLRANPDLSALAVRERYFRVAAPRRASRFPVISLE